MVAKSTKIDGFDERGKFAKGNTIGRMKKKGFTLTDLNKVVVAYEKAHDVTILKHYVEQLLEDNNLLSKYIDKNVPTKQINELTGADGSPMQFIIKMPQNSENEPIDEKKASQD